MLKIKNKHKKKKNIFVTTGEKKHANSANKDYTTFLMKMFLNTVLLNVFLSFILSLLEKVLVKMIVHFHLQYV